MCAYVCVHACVQCVHSLWLKLEPVGGVGIYECNMRVYRRPSVLTIYPLIARQLRDAAAQDRQAVMSVSFPEPAQQDDNILVSDGGVGALAPAASDAQGSRSRVLKSRKSAVKVKKTIAKGKKNIVERAVERAKRVKEKYKKYDASAKGRERNKRARKAKKEKMGRRAQMGAKKEKIVPGESSETQDKFVFLHVLEKKWSQAAVKSGGSLSERFSVIVPAVSLRRLLM